MKKTFHLILLASICHLQAQDTDILLSNALAKELIDSSLKNEKQDTLIENNEKKLEKAPDTESIHTCIPINHVQDFIHKEMEIFSAHLENSFKQTGTNKTKKQCTIEDKDNLIIIKCALSHNFSMEKAMLDIIDNKHFTVNLNEDTSKVIVSGLITQNIIHVTVHSETKQTNKKGDTRTSFHESSMTHPLMGRIQDLENNIKAEYSSDTYELIITLHKETPKKHSIKVVVR